MTAKVPWPPTCPHLQFYLPSLCQASSLQRGPAMGDQARTRDKRMHGPLPCTLSPHTRDTAPCSLIFQMGKQGPKNTRLPQDTALP